MSNSASSSSEPIAISDSKAEDSKAKIESSADQDVHIELEQEADTAGHKSGSVKRVYQSDSHYHMVLNSSTKAATAVGDSEGSDQAQ